MSALEVLALAVNNISTLRDVQNSFNLRELYLRKNAITDMIELKYLCNLRRLKILSLNENPIADHPLYRLLVIKCVPSLEKLDNDIVTTEEKAKAMQVDESEYDSYFGGGGNAAAI